ncbi:MAG: hypothetical protein FD169_2095 [Bacillota bacterium]|nr:MAG: hypothetical protein FD169_2095 [Bacillota bacterium]MBS3949630.1 SdpI family protein [Peptococcaceae bacterium]
MNTFFWIVDLLIPIMMIVLGFLLRTYPPKSINGIVGYRTARSMKSQPAWDYAQRRIGDVWIKFSPWLLVAIILSKMLVPLDAETLSLIHMGVSLFALILGIPLVEKELKDRF